MNNDNVDLLVRLRNWLIMLLAGRSMVILNAHVEVRDFQHEPVWISGDGSLVVGCRFPRLQGKSLHFTRWLHPQFFAPPNGLWVDPEGESSDS